MDGKHGEVPDLLYEEIAGSTESLFRASTMKKLCSTDSQASSSLSYSAVSSVNDLTDVLRLRESVTHIKTQVAVANSPDQVRASIDLLHSSSLKFSKRRSKTDMRPEREEIRTMDTRKSAEHLIALAENQSIAEANVQITADVILQVFSKLGDRPTIDQLITLVRRLKRVPENASSELQRRLSDEQHRTDSIKQQLTASKEQISEITKKLREHSGQMDTLSKAVSELYSMMKEIGENWEKERKVTESMRSRGAGGNQDEAATIKRSLQETEKRCQETKKMLGAETIKGTEIRQKLPSPEAQKTTGVQTEKYVSVSELHEQREALLEHLTHMQGTLDTVRSGLSANLEVQISDREIQLHELRQETSEIEAIFQSVIESGRGKI